MRASLATHPKLPACLKGPLAVNAEDIAYGENSLVRVHWPQRMMPDPVVSRAPLALKCGFCQSIIPTHILSVQ